MKEQLISLKTAKLAKEKGFKLQSGPFGYITKFYRPSTGTLLSYGRTGRSKISDLIYASTQSLLQKWLREKHNIIIKADIIYDSWTVEKSKFGFEVFRFGIDFLKNNPSEYQKSRLYVVASNANQVDSYEEALEFGLQEALKLIEIKKGTNGQK